MLDGMRQNAGSWIIKLLFLIIVLAFVLAYGTGSMNQSGSGILAYVDETPILIKDFERQYQQDIRMLQAQLPNLSPDDLQGLNLKEASLAKMVNTVLMDRKATDLGLTVTDTELATFIRSNPAFWNKDRTFDAAFYDRAVRSQGMTPAAFEAATRRQIMQDKLMRYAGLAAQVQESEARDLFLFGQEKIKVDYLLFNWQDFKDGVVPTQAEIDTYYADNEDRFKRPATASFTVLGFTPRALAKGQTVSDEEVRAYYDAHPSEFQAPEMVRARHILIKLDADAPKAEADKARLKLIKLKARMVKGAKFADLAKKHSEGPSNVRGGDLGWFAKDAMVKPFADASFAMQPGDISDPVRTEFGWHLIKVEERRDAGQKTFDEAASEIREMLAEEKAADSMSDTLDMAIARIIAGDTLAQVGEALGLTPTPVPAVPKVLFTQQLGVDEDSAQMLYDLEVGKATEIPVEINDGYLLAEKLGDNPAAVAPLDDVKATIIEALKREGAMKLAREKAAETLAGAASGAPLPGEVKTSEPFQRSGMVAELGLNPTLVEAAFAADESVWMPEPYAVSEGYAMVRLSERLLPSDDQWNKAKDAVMAQIRQSREQEMFKAYLIELRDNAKVEIIEAKVME